VRKKLFNLILNGTSDNNIPFQATCNLLERLGFKKRVRGSHHIFTKDGIQRTINLQRRKDGTCKPYQVRQMREFFNLYDLGE
jgi:predicted RNA binding protein YcfA (HicA-like mRNA interferase family)